MIISLTIGNETYRNPDCSMRLSASYHQPGQREPQSVVDAARDPGSGMRFRSAEQHPASNVNPAHGIWNTNSYEVPEGAIIQITAMYDSDSTCIMILRVRENAPLIRLGIKLTGHERAARTWAYYEGRFDIMELDDIDDDVEKWLPQNASYFNLEAIREATSNFAYQELEAGVPYQEPITTEIKTTAGKVITVQTGSRRKIRLRRSE